MKPVRYLSTHVPLTLWQSILWFIKRREWTRYRVDYRPVFDGEPGYDDAPYEMAVIYQRAPIEVVEEHSHKP